MLYKKNELDSIAQSILEKANVRTDNAKIVADALVTAELDGIHSHGFARLPSYADHARCGKADGNATPEIIQKTKNLIYADAKGGFAYPAVYKGLELAMSVAKETGMAMLGVGHSHHAGVLGQYAEKVSREKLMCICFSNSPAAMAPWGGNKGTFGTNPIAFGCPTTSKDPLVIDMALSKVARGKIMAAKQKNQDIPEGWALNKDGKPTTSAPEALAGTMIPMADAKGAALALMVEILSATLTSSSYGYEASSFFDTKGGSPNIGQSFILINPEGMASDFYTRLQALFDFMIAQDGVRLSGERRFALRAEHMKNGVNVPDALCEELKAKYM